MRRTDLNIFRRTATVSTNTLERLVFIFALVIFFTSGFAALLYQIIWQRMLAIFSGADVYSVTIIVAAYMAGLGCGSLAGGYLSDCLSRWANLMLFAGAELLIALFALVSKGIYYDYLYLQHNPLARSPWVLTIVLFISLLWPTFFMGMSLPLLARALTREIKAAAWTIGSLYGYNTLGAAGGALITTWIFLRQFGLETSLQVGAILNLSVSLCVLPLAVYLFWHRQRFPLAQPIECKANSLTADKSVEDSISFSFSFWILIYALSGFIALSLEILWFRLLGIMLKSTAFTFGTLLAIYLTGLALGTILGTLLVGRSSQPTRSFLAFQAGTSLYAALTLTLFIGILGNDSYLAPLWQYFGASGPIDIGVAVETIQQYFYGIGLIKLPATHLALKFLALYFVLPAFLVGPPTLMMGISFPYLQKAIQREAAYLGRRVGWLQTSNIVGSILGTILTGWAWLPLFGTVGTLKLLLVLAGVFLLLWTRIQFSDLSRLRIGAYVGSVALVAFVSGIVPDASTLWAKLHGTTPDRIIFAEDGTGVSLIKSSRSDFVGPSAIFTNGRTASWIPYGNIHTLLGALPVLLHPNPKEIAVIGLASGDTLFHIGGRPEVVEITCIEIIGAQLRTLYSFASRQDYPALLSILKDQRIKHVVADGRIYIMHQGKKYDIIEADALWPNSAYAGNLYSEEYFTLIRNHLKFGGLGVTWSPTSRVHKTFIKVFPYVLSFGEVLVGSNEPINLNLDEIDRRIDYPFAQDYYSRSFVDIKDTIHSFINTRKPVFFGPNYDRSVLNDTNSDLFPKDEYLVPRHRP